MNYLVRIGRLIRAESIKTFSHPFVYISSFVTILVVMLSLYLRYHMSGESAYGSSNSFLLFATGCKYGFKVVSLMVLIIGGMTFAGEYDRGTIKNLLTRPVSRSDVFCAKLFFMVLLTIGLLFMVIYMSSLMSMILGDLGPVWDKEDYIISVTYEKLQHVGMLTLLMSLASPFAAAFVGLFISTTTESSGFAVALALIIFFVFDITGVLLSESVNQYMFSFYPDHLFDVLKQYGEGSASYPISDLHAKWRNAFLIPGIYMVVLSFLSYLFFRFKNVHA